MTTSYTPGKQVDGRTVQPAATKSTHPGLSVMRPICAARKTLGYKNLLVRYSSDVDDPEKYAIRAEPTPNALRHRTNIGVPPQVTRIFADALVMSFAVGCGMGILESIALIISGTWPGLIVGSAFLPLGGFPASNYIIDRYKSTALQCQEEFGQERRKARTMVRRWTGLVALGLTVGFFVGCLIPWAARILVPIFWHT